MDDSYPTHRMDFGVTVVNDILYVIGGYYISEPVSGRVMPTSANEEYIPIGYGTPDPSYIPPIESTVAGIKVVSPVNQTYNESSVSLIFTVNNPVNWIGYSLDGQENVTITGNSTIANITRGLHNVIVYANDSFRDIDSSETVTFSIASEPSANKEPFLTLPVSEPFPVVPVATVSAGVVAIVAGLLIYYRKKKRHVRGGEFR